MNRKNLIRLTALLLALLMPVTTAVTALGSAPSQDAADGSSYDSPDINALMGAGEEPEEISVSAGATYQEKAWYEYIAYSEHAVSSYRYSEDMRLLFYDPYTYTNAMIMNVESDPSTSWDTMSSYTISHTNSKQVSAALSSTYTTTTATQTSGRDITHSGVENTGSTTTTYNHKSKSKDRGEIIGENRITHEILESATELGKEGGLVGIVATETIKIGIDTTQEHNHTTYNDHGTDTDYSGSDTVEYNTLSTTEGWTELSARITATTGSSTSTNKTISETESTTITKTYAATHFASDGVSPLPWSIVHYSVQLPMKCCLQIKQSGEWVTVSTGYCMLTTIQGTCRAWQQNGQVYYEDWGNGEPVVDTDFWSQFMTEDNLIKAYKGDDTHEPKLYPTGGLN